MIRGSMKSVFEYKIDFGFKGNPHSFHEKEYAYNKQQAPSKFKKRFKNAVAITLEKGKQIRDERTATFLLTGKYK
jgi:hypothetical protein